MPKSISDTELLAAISAAEENALGNKSSAIASDREEAINRYLGKPYDDEQPGRSSVVSRDVSDVVLGVAANVLKPFVGGDEIIQFTPRSQEDEEQAQQETDYINYVCLERNNGFLVLSSAVHDALLLRNGYVKAQWFSQEDIVTETYQGLSEEELALLMQDEDVKVTQQTPIMGGEFPMYDVKVKRVKPVEYVKLFPLPPDELLVSDRVRSASLQDVDFIQHRPHLTISQVREMGYNIPDDIPDDEDGPTTEEFARNRFGNASDEFDDETDDPSRRIVMFKETLIRIDRDGDGVAELRRVCQIGKTILADDEADMVDIACFIGIVMPHQHLGQSVYDLVADIARIKTALTRAYLDNKYLANNARMLVDTSRVNIDDVLVSRPGGIIRVNGDPSTAVLPVATQDTGTTALQGLEYMDSVRENRTGYTRQSQGLNTDALVTNTVGGMEMQLSQSQLRLEMIARTIAETGMRDLFRIVHALTLKHSTRTEKVKLRNKWVEVNPREWVARHDLSISVGLGASSQQLKVQNLLLIAQQQDRAGMLGLVGPQEVYNVCKQLSIAVGFKNEEQFFKQPQVDPQTGQAMMPPPKPDPAVQVAQIKAQTDMQKAQMDAQSRQNELNMQAQVKQQELQGELANQASNDQRQAALDERKAAFDAQQAERDHQYKLVELQKEYEFKYWEAQQKIEQQREAAHLSAQATVQASKNKPNGKSGNV